MGSRYRTNSYDIAHLAGVSQPTVSRALRNSPLVSEETREKVQRIARELNYRVDKNASNLRSQTSGTLALLFFEDSAIDESQINPFFVSMLASITRACGKRGYDLLVSYQQSSQDWHADYGESHRADGLILLGYGDDIAYLERMEKMLASRTPFVRWGAVDHSKPWVSVGSDNDQGGFAMTEYLLQSGRKRIAFLGDATEHYPEFQARFRGYQAAHAQAKIEADPDLHVSVSESSQSAGQHAVQSLLAKKRSFDAIFAASDLVAIGAIKALLQAGIKVPEQVAVAGFDDLPISIYSTPTLSTVAQNTKAAGETLVDAVLRLVRGEKVESQKIATELRIRESC
jgi:DNA-binding LacI/PurR family transcriptional regulator